MISILFNSLRKIYLIAADHLLNSVNFVSKGRFPIWKTCRTKMAFISALKIAYCIFVVPSWLPLSVFAGNSKANTIIKYNSWKQPCWDLSASCTDFLVIRKCLPKETWKTLRLRSLTWFFVTELFFFLAACIIWPELRWILLSGLCFDTDNYLNIIYLNPTWLNTWRIIET